MKKNDWYAIASLVVTLLIAIIAYNVYETEENVENLTEDSVMEDSVFDEEMSRNDTINLMAQAFSIQESQENPSAVSPCGKYVGCLQISKIMVQEANRILGEERFTHGDFDTEDHRYSKEHSYEIFRIVMEYHNPKLNMDRAVDVWNRGAPSTYRNNVKNNFANLLGNEVQI